MPFNTTINSYNFNTQLHFMKKIDEDITSCLENITVDHLKLNEREKLEMLMIVRRSAIQYYTGAMKEKYKDGIPRDLEY